MMSDITRDDLRKPVHEETQGEPWVWYDKLTDEEFDRLAREAGYRRLVDIADVDRLIMDAVTTFPAKALRALLTDECEPCKGTGQFLTYGVPCNVCGGRGWLPKDGLVPLTVSHGGSYADPHTGEEREAEPVLHGKDIEGSRTYLPYGEYLMFRVTDWLEAEDEA